MVSAPVVILAVIQSAVYDNYSQSYHAEGLWPLIILIFPFWSLVVSYIGVRTTFDVSKWRARTWFIILPGILYVVLFGGLTALYALMPALQSG